MSDTPLTEEVIDAGYVKDIGLDDLEHYMKSAGRLATHARKLERALARFELLYRTEAAERRADALQAKIDRLMFEYCPDEMTPEQVSEWGRNQVVAPEPETLRIDAAPAALPDGNVGVAGLDALLEEYWDSAYEEGSRQVSLGDRANAVLCQIRELFAAANAREDYRTHHQLREE